MSLQEAAQARKEKLLALKKRKATHDEPSTSFVPPPSSIVSYRTTDERGTSRKENETSGEVFKFRNYDSSTGAARKHLRTEEGDTVESAVAGLTEKVLLEDEARRAQELVSSPSCFHRGKKGLRMKADG